ncbi:aldo/keto reductase [Lactobacillus hamsteri]|uniref:NADP-dependent oxidoreductase domain-containing protein n=1 Tax=Lactobacillus hamsteri DSM 5661 = JCM 6256 TaxID=1423754 RepID=A0A0R1YNE8_9LACO|nr:aldo/keto reductase [Lactobacillus hamsteri]KRM41302.1 hypothetical protein FC39_GL001110 [Lactobacillus hamsteri DSM 5661 = JCM 6256]
MAIFDEAVILNDGCLMPKFGVSITKNADINKAVKCGGRLINLIGNKNNAINKSEISPQIFLQFNISKEITADNITIFILEKLKSAHLQYLDLVVMEASEDDERNIQVWQKLEELKIKGRIKSIGVSDLYLDGLKGLLEKAKVKPVLDKLNLVDPKLEEFLNKQKIQVEQDFVEENNDTLNDIATVKKVDPIQVLLRYNLFENKIILMNLKDDFQVKDINLTPEERQRIENSLRS